MDEKNITMTLAVEVPEGKRLTRASLKGAEGESNTCTLWGCTQGGGHYHRGMRGEEDIIQFD